RTMTNISATRPAALSPSPVRDRTVAARRAGRRASLEVPEMALTATQHSSRMRTSTMLCRTMSRSTEHLPGSFEGETISRRRFMTGTVHAAGAAAGAAIALPALGFALAPVFDRTAAGWQDVGPLTRFTESTYVPVIVTIEPGVGDAGRSTAYVRLHSPSVDGPVKDRFGRVVAISSRCAHVGCSVRCFASAESFVCPCHGCWDDFRGIRVGG